MKIKNIKTNFQNELQSVYDKDEIDSFFFMITETLYRKKRIDFTLNPDFEITNTTEWETIISDLKEEKPIQYVLGEAWFYGLKFKVNENTLIPRSETEELVEWILDSLMVKGKRQKVKDISLSEVEKEPLTQNPKPLTLLDIGTGTGCIPISLKSNLPDTEIFAIDISEKTLEVAIQNAKNNNVEVNFIQTDILKIENLEKLSTKFDIIISNPPYVRHLEKQEIKKNVLDYEPHLALFVEDNDALIFYRKIAQLALHSLKANGLLFFEINQYLGKKTVELLENLGFKNIELRKDLKGNDRMIKCSV